MSLLLFSIFRRIVLYVHGKNVITDITLNDGEWHFICTTWTSLNGKYEIYIDGGLRDAGYNLSTNLVIEANGTVVVGQEQVSTFIHTYTILMGTEASQLNRYE